MATDTVGVGRAFTFSSLLTKKNIKAAQQYIALAMMVAGALSNVETLTAQTAIVAVGGALYAWTKKYFDQFDDDDLERDGFSYPPFTYPPGPKVDLPMATPSDGPSLEDVSQ